MKTREKGCHYGIILFALANILIGFSGYVCAAPSNGEGGPEVQKEEGGKVDLVDVAVDKLEVEPKGESEYEKRQFNAEYGPTVEENLNGLIAMVKWRNTDHMYVKKHDSKGWYDTIGTVISKKAIICMPSNQLRVDPALGTGNWYIKSVLIRLDDVAARKRIDKKDFVVYYNDHFEMSRDAPHRLAMVVLTQPLGDDVKTASLVLNPLMPPPPKPRDAPPDSRLIMITDDYAVTACTMLVVDVMPDSAHIKITGLPMIATKCMIHEGPDGKNTYFDSKICVHLKIPFYMREMLSDRAAVPNDVGAPLFCNNYLTGLYTGVQNLEGNKYGSTVGSVNTSSDIMFGGRLNGPDEQYTFEVPGMDRNWEFITSFTGDSEDKVDWSSFMPLKTDEICLPPPELVGSTTEVPETGGGGGGEEGPNTPRPGPGESAAKPADRGEKETSKSKATPTFQLSPLFAVATLVTITMTSLSERC